jgi:hypothetical protein
LHIPPLTASRTYILTWWPNKGTKTEDLKKIAERAVIQDEKEKAGGVTEKPMEGKENKTESNGIAVKAS